MIASSCIRQSRTMFDSFTGALFSSPQLELQTAQKMSTKFLTKSPPFAMSDDDSGSSHT